MLGGGGYSPSLWFSTYSQKNLSRALHVADVGKKIVKFSITPPPKGHFWDTQYSNILDKRKKISKHTLAKMIFLYYIFFVDFWVTLEIYKIFTLLPKKIKMLWKYRLLFFVSIFRVSTVKYTLPPAVQQYNHPNIDILLCKTF